MAEKPSISKVLQKEEIQLLADASKTSQNQDKKAEQFREMLIQRECISFFDTYEDFKEKKNIIQAIKMCWKLGYDDQITSKNLSGGLLSDFDFIQATPSKTLRSLTQDDVELERLTAKRESEIHRINRNCDLFIRNMGWTEGRPTKKRVVLLTKDQLASAINNVIAPPATVDVVDTGSVVSNLSGSESLGKAMGMACLSEEATESAPVNAAVKKSAPVKSAPLNGEVNVMDSDASDEEAEEVEEVGTSLETLMNDVADGCSVVVFRDDSGKINTKTLTAKSTKVVKSTPEEQEYITFWAYYWKETEEPMTEEEYLLHLKNGGDEAEVVYCALEEAEDEGAVQTEEVLEE
jgi:hypothetical protein